MNITIEQALEKVWSLGQADKMEHLVSYRPSPSPARPTEGPIIIDKQGTSHAVQLGDELHAGLLLPGDVLVHNHPSLQGLSMEDVLLSAHTHTTVWAVTSDQSCYWVVGDGDKLGEQACYDTFDSVRDYLGLGGGWDGSQEGAISANLFNHLWQTTFRYKGLLEYGASLEQETLGLLDSLCKRLGQPSAQHLYLALATLPAPARNGLEAFTF